MLIPQFTMRRMLIAVTGLSVVFVVLAQAVAGQLWAIGVIVGLVALAAILLVHGITFFMVWLFAGVTATLVSPRTHLVRGAASRRSPG